MRGPLAAQRMRDPLATTVFGIAPIEFPSRKIVPAGAGSNSARRCASGSAASSLRSRRASACSGFLRPALHVRAAGRIRPVDSAIGLDSRLRLPPPTRRRGRRRAQRSGIARHRIAEAAAARQVDDQASALRHDDGRPSIERLARRRGARRSRVPPRRRLPPSRPRAGLLAAIEGGGRAGERPAVAAADHDALREPPRRARRRPNRPGTPCARRPPAPALR